MSLKAKIRKEAVSLFNKSSYAAVTLHELAQNMGISRGNLTYHYKTKEDLLIDIVNEMLESMEVNRKKARQLPSFENLHNEIQLYYKFQKSYSFFFLDSPVMRLPKINEVIKKLSAKSIDDHKAAIAFAIDLGNMEPEPVPGVYHNLAVNTWILTFFWPAQKILRGTTEDGEKMIWSLLVPYFTDKGIASFKKFFGADYFDSLGAPFTFDINTYISF
ncbi:MAG: TetR/AcrR family transcriptional regulator [Flavobacteriales bacterium]|nr:TetR/AcrR family transcriptional regulator [Flavobacteriales bacterium]